MSYKDSVQGVKLELFDITRSQINLAEEKLYTGVETVSSEWPSCSIRGLPTSRSNGWVNHGCPDATLMRAP